MCWCQACPQTAEKIARATRKINRVHTMEPPPPKRPKSDASELLAQAERELEASQVDVETMDANSLKRLILHVEKQINSNMALRMKYADQPEHLWASLQFYRLPSLR